MKDIGKNIRHFRIAKNITQDELSEKLFVTRQTISNYETGKSRPDVDMLVRISEVLETDIHQIIYGPEPKHRDIQQKRLIGGVILTVVLGLALYLLYPIARRIFYSTYHGGFFYFVLLILRPVLVLTLGWTVSQVTAMALKKEPLRHPATMHLRRILLLTLVLLLVLSLWYCAATMLNDFLYDARLRGEWVEHESNGVPVPAWNKLPTPVPGWLNWFFGHFLFRLAAEYYWLLLIPGALLWLLGFPRTKTV